MPGQARLLDDADRVIIARVDGMLHEVIPLWYGIASKRPAIGTAGSLLVRISGSWKSVSKLLDNCSDDREMELLSNDAAVIIRFMHDAALQSEYVLEGDSALGLTSDELGRLYLDYEIVERYLLATEAMKYPSWLSKHLAASPLRPQGEERNREAFDRVKSRYLIGSGGKVRSHWYHGNLAEIAQKVGRKVEYFYFLKLFNSAVHGGPLATFMVFRSPLIRTLRACPSHASRGSRGRLVREQPGRARLEAPSGSRR